MSHITAGETITDYLTHIGNNGAAIAGATFTVVTSRKPSGDSFTPTVTDLGGGSYRIEIPTARSEAGQWYLLLADQSLSPVRYYDNSWDVDPAPADPNTVTSGPATRGSLRRSIGRLLGDLIVCTLTDTLATGSQFVDKLNLVYNNNELVGRRAYVSYAYNGQNLGVSRRVSGNTRATATAQVTPDFPAPTTAGDVIELYNERDLGPSVDDIHAVINSVILSAQDVNLTETVGSSAAFAETAPLVSIPSSWRFFTGADWQDRRGIWRPVPPADLRVDPPNRTVEIRNRSAYLADGLQVRLRGTVAAAALEADDDATSVDAEWLKYQAAAELLISTSHRAHDTAVSERKAQYFQTLADSRRPKARSRVAGKAVKLP